MYVELHHRKRKANRTGHQFLADAALITPKPDNLTTADAATVGVGFYTAALGVFDGLNIPIPEDPKKLPAATGEWALVLGGSSSVGKFALQLLKALGYKVVVTCSPGSAEVRFTPSIPIAIGMTAHTTY
jgi:NADPH:quinone reductase-like Zn-dependent oxidoreductase